MSNMTAAAVETAATRVVAAAAAVGVAAAGAGTRTSKLFVKETKAKKCHKVNFNAIVSHSYHDDFNVYQIIIFFYVFNLIEGPLEV
jgi:hypothetical protein